MQWKVGLFIALVTLTAIPAIGADRAPDKPLTFERDIRPIFKLHCFQCHGEGDQLKGKLDLRLRRFAIKGGKTGPAIVAGQRDQSFLFDRITKGEMPPEKKPKLSAIEIEIIGKWISQGAPTIRSEPLTVSSEPIITEEERSFWAFQPIRVAPVPAVQHVDQVRTPIDAFLLAKLEEKQLSLSADAEKRTLIRRATFDLTGLPPTPQEIELFLADTAPDSYDRLIDRLLASPRYGEHWGRHWLDVAGYADSDGYTEADIERKYAWHYRDYVIRCINEDKPFDQFIIEQLAGDELVKQPFKDLKPDEVQKLTATGFLRMAPDGTAAVGIDKKLVCNQVVADEIKVVSTTLLGLTVGCAQCHDHRYDPIPQADYYRLRAIFEPAFNCQTWRMPQDRLVSLLSDSERKRAAEIEAQAVKLDTARLKWEAEIVDQKLEVELKKIPQELHESIRKAFHTTLTKRKLEQVKLLAEHPNTLISIGSVANVDKVVAAEQKKKLDESAALRATKPVEEIVEALSEVPGQLPATHLFYRGDCDQPKQVVPPAELTVLASDKPVKIPEKDASLPTSGRRLAYSRWLTSGKHPLVSRVLVNRIWMHHFGRGIVATPSDFGMLGERPTHPELLDWLANDFTSNGWKLKRLHKLIMLSTAYRQVSDHNGAQDAVDPDNKLLGRKSLQRLEAEEFRDAVLFNSGKLNPKMFGPPVPVMPDEVGQFVVGKENVSAGRPGPVIPLNGEEYRRSVYVQVRRSRPLSILATFDEPTMEPNCEVRKASTVAPQALLLMNNDFVVVESMDFAQRVRREAGDDPKAQVLLAWQLAYGTEPSKEELADLLGFLDEQTRHFKGKLPVIAAAPMVKPVVAKAATTKPTVVVKPATAVKAAAVVKPPADPSLQALGTLCQALWSSNPFLYVD